MSVYRYVFARYFRQVLVCRFRSCSRLGNSVCFERKSGLKHVLDPTLTRIDGPLVVLGMRLAGYSFSDRLLGVLSGGELSWGPNVCSQALGAFCCSDETGFVVVKSKSEHMWGLSSHPDRRPFRRTPVCTVVTATKIPPNQNCAWRKPDEPQDPARSLNHVGEYLRQSS